MNNVADHEERFEDRLLSVILDDFEQLTSCAPPREALPFTHGSRVVRAFPARRVVPALAAGVVAAALIAAGVVETGSGTPSGVTSKVAAGQSPTQAQLVLYRLASVSATMPATRGQYVELGETDSETGEPGQSRRITVVDTQDGASTTYQEPYAGSGAPSVLTGVSDPTSTAAYYAALPTDPVALRATLLTIAQQQQDQAQAQMSHQATTAGKALAGPVELATPTDDDFVFEEAVDMLWNPVVQPALRSALYKVLAGTSGVIINPQSTDPDGRPAIEMSRRDVGVPSSSTTYEDPTTGAVLAQIWSTTGSTPSDTDTITAVYRPVTSSNTMPSDPYSS